MKTAATIVKEDTASITFYNKYYCPPNEMFTYMNRHIVKRLLIFGASNLKRESIWIGNFKINMYDCRVNDDAYDNKEEFPNPGYYLEQL